MIPKCPHAYTEYEENYHLDMCRLHPEKLYGVGENDCEWCPQCPDKDWQEWKHSLRPSPEPTAVRPIYGSIERYEMDLETGTISYKVVQTNADRIRSMTDEELVDVLLTYRCKECDWDGGFCGKGEIACRKEILLWLKQGVTE